MTRTITRSSGHVFRDLGLPAGEATRLLIRADLLIEIERIASSRRLSNAALAKLLRVSRRRVDALRRGRLHSLLSEQGSPSRKPHVSSSRMNYCITATTAPGRVTRASSKREQSPSG